jgi:hypothetical protein
MPTYAYITQAQFLTQLASRLYDPLEQQYSHAEKTLYLADALRTWNALTATWRGDFTGNTILNTAFYDLTSTATFPNTLRPLTLLDTDLYLPMQYHLLEPPSGVNPWSGVSSQFSADDLIQAVARRRDELLSISGCTITRRLVPAAPGRTQLPDGVIDVRRVAYAPSTQFPGTLIQSTGGTGTIMFRVRVINLSTIGNTYTITGTYKNLGTLAVVISLVGGANSSSVTIPAGGFANISLSIIGTEASVFYNIGTVGVGDPITLVGAAPTARDVTGNLTFNIATNFTGTWIAQNNAVITLTQGVLSQPSATSPMFPDDTWSLQAFNRGYTTATPGTPSVWMLNTQPPIAFDVDRQPSSGNYDILTVDAGLALSPQIPNPLSVPDDWTHVIKWGALGDLLSREANAADPMRAAYCNQRFIMGAGLLTDAPALLAARIANVPVQIDAMRNADMYTVSWQNLPAGVPASILQSGLNIIAVSPPPDTGPYSMTFTVVQNAPIPANDAAPVQLARDDLDAVLGYAVHIAMFKSGGSEFTDTMPLLDNFIKAAARYNSKLRECGEFTKILQGVSQQEERFAPRMEPEVQSSSS